MGVILLLLALAGCTSCSTRQGVDERTPTAPFAQNQLIWGGNHVELAVTAQGATLEFDCALGAMDSPLRPDDNGDFVVTGTFTPERGGPSRDDDPRPLKATYSGTIKDNAMTLKIVVDGQDPKGMAYELTRGQRGNVRKCR